MNIPEGQDEQQDERTLGDWLPSLQLRESWRAETDEAIRQEVERAMASWRK